MITNPFAIFCVLTLVVLVSVHLEARYKLFKSFSAALVGILIAMVFSNTGLIPGNSRAYDVLIDPGISLGIVLILLEVNLKTIRQAGPVMLIAFGLGAVGTAAGAFVSALVLAPAVGPETWKLAGQFTGTYNGGGVNFAALGRAFDTSSDLFAAAIAADVLITAFWLMCCLAAPVVFARGRHIAPETGGGQAQLAQSLYSSKAPTTLADATLLVVVAVGTVWAARRVGTWIPLIPEVLWLTTITLIVAQIPRIKAIPGAALWGYYLLLLFLTTNGAQSVVKNIISVGPAVLYFAMGTVVIHGLFVFGLGWLLRLDPATLAVASQANVGGPASAMALATARGSTHLVLPGIAVGLVGYAIGNYTGFAVGMLARGALGF